MSIASTMSFFYIFGIYIIQAFISCPVGIQTIGYVMAAYGASTTIFALLLSRLSKYTGRHILFAVASLVNLGTFVVLYLWTPSRDHISVIYLVPIAWGLSEGIWQTQSNGMKCFTIWPCFYEIVDVAFKLC